MLSTRRHADPCLMLANPKVVLLFGLMDSLSPPNDAVYFSSLSLRVVRTNPQLQQFLTKRYYFLLDAIPFATLHILRQVAQSISLV